MGERADPAIVNWGRLSVADYPAAEYEAALRRSFVDLRADFIVLDDHTTGQRFRAACVAWAIDDGLLYCSGSESDGQQVVSSFRLTFEGRRRLGLE